MVEAFFKSFFATNCYIKEHVVIYFEKRDHTLNFGYHSNRMDQCFCNLTTFYANLHLLKFTINATWHKLLSWIKAREKPRVLLQFVFLILNELKNIKAKPWLILGTGEVYPIAPKVKFLLFTSIPHPPL